MKNYFAAILCLVLLVMSNGCTFYNAAVDERNVRTVANDTTIKATILQKFIEDDVVQTFDIDVNCYYSHVYLIGEYNAEKQKSRAIKIARNVEGVKGVTTYFLKKKDDDPCGSIDNLAFKAKIKAKLIKDGDIWSTNINVIVVQCNVVFVGLVGSDKEIEKIIAHAKSVEGIRSVKSFLKVAPHHNL